MRRRNPARWRAIEGRLGREMNIWVATVRPNDTPHLQPAWFVWLEEKLYFVVDSRSEQFQNLRGNQSVSLTLPDAESVILIEGEAHTSDRVTRDTLADYFYNKYEFDFTQDRAYDWKLVEVTPHQIFAWGDGYDQEGIQVF